MTGITYASVCSGIEAPTVAWEPLGWRPLWFSEIDAFPSQLLSEKYPQVKNLGDMQQIQSKLVDKSVLPDVFIGGTPCQSFSLAGLRAGLHDNRGNLTLTFVEIANAISTARAIHGLPPPIIIWENVPGVLSDTTNAFGCLVAALAGMAETIVPIKGKWGHCGIFMGTQRTVGWRILDAQHFGIPQMRRRVFLCAHPRPECTIKVLFEPESGGGHTKESATAQYSDTQAATNRVTGNLYRMMAFGQYTQDIRASTIKARDYKDATDLIIEPNGSVRRLTPLECERLQGFPDNYTQITFNKKPAHDKHRYKALGNSMAVPVIRWLGHNISNWYQTLDTYNEHAMTL